MPAVRETPREALMSEDGENANQMTFMLASQGRNSNANDDFDPSALTP